MEQATRIIPQTNIIFRENASYNIEICSTVYMEYCKVAFAL
jgi:hypothetical protein